MPRWASGHPTAHRDDLRGDVGGFRRAEECDDGGDLCGEPGPIHGYQALDRLLIEQSLGHRRADDPRGYGVDGDPAAADLERERLGGGIDGALGGRVVDLAFVAEQSRDRRDVDDPSPAGADHRHQQRLRDIEESVDGDIDYPVPLFRTHPGQNGVVVDARVVHQDLNGSRAQYGIERLARAFRIRDIEMQRHGTAACRGDLFHEFLRRIDPLPGVYVHVVPIAGQATADCSADTATAAGNQRPLDRLAHERPASNTMPALPLSSSRPALDTVNSYKMLPSSPARRSALAIRSVSRSSRRLTCSTRFLTLVSSPARHAAPAVWAMMAPCTAMACAAYSTPHAAPSRPWARSGLSASRWLVARHLMCAASQLNTSSRRHMRP